MMVLLLKSRSDYSQSFLSKWLETDIGIKMQWWSSANSFVAFTKDIKASGGDKVIHMLEAYGIILYIYDF